MKAGPLKYIAVFAAILLLPSSSRAQAATDWDESIDVSLSRAIGWLEGVHVDPYQGDVFSFRLATVEIETWHRLWVLEEDPQLRERYKAETIARLSEILDSEKLETIIDLPEGPTMFSEVALLASRCRTHGLSQSVLSDALLGRGDALQAKIDEGTPSLRALYAVYLPEMGVSLDLSLDAVLASGMLALRPREADLTMAQVYYLTHEIYALTDYALQPLDSLSEETNDYLLRVLPFYTSFYGALDQTDLEAELIACLNVAGMRDTYAYNDGIRHLMEGQNADGSFGAPDPNSLGRPVQKRDYLHPTMNCISVLALERGCR